MDTGFKDTLSRLRNIVNHRYPEGLSKIDEDNLNTSEKNTNLKNHSGNLALQKIVNSNVPPSTENKNQDLFDFLEKQNGHIVQLEKDRQVGNDELTLLLTKVKGIIAENEELHEEKRLTMEGKSKIKDDFDYSSSNSCKSGKVIRDSKIVELEGQLMQYKRELQLAQELKRKQRSTEDQWTDSKFKGSVSCVSCNLQATQFEELQREKTELYEKISKMEGSLRKVRESESDALRKLKNLIQDQDIFKEKKIQTDLEITRLKEELDRVHLNHRDFLQETCKKLQGEKIEAEKKYRRELEHLNAEMSLDYETLTKVKIELERQKRVETELRREIQVKNGLLEELKLEIKTKVDHLQAELSQSLSLRSAIEQDFVKYRLQADKSDRDGKFEGNRLRAELNVVRTRLEQTEEEMRHQGKIAGQINVAEGDISAIIHTMEDKQLKSIAELEHLIEVQNNLMNNLRTECHSLAEKLEESVQQNKTNVLEAVRQGLQSGSHAPAPVPRELLDELTTLAQQMTDSALPATKDGGDGETEEKGDDAEKTEEKVGKVVEIEEIEKWQKTIQALIDRFQSK